MVKNLYMYSIICDFKKTKNMSDGFISAYTVYWIFQIKKGLPFILTLMKMDSFTYNFTHIMFGRIFYSLASGSICFETYFFSSIYTLPVPDTVGQSEYRLLA